MLYRAGSDWHDVSGGTNAVAVVFIICVKRDVLMSTAPEDVEDGVEEEDCSRSCSTFCVEAFCRDTCVKSIRKHRQNVDEMSSMRWLLRKCRSYLT